MTRHALVLPNPAGPGSCPNRSGAPVRHVAVGSRTAREFVAFHDSLESFSLGGADHIDPLALLEKLCPGVDLGNFFPVFKAKLKNDPLGGGSVLLEVTQLGLQHPLFLLVPISNLHPVVAIALGGFSLHEFVAAYLDDRDGNHNSRLFIEDARHPDFLANQS